LLVERIQAQVNMVWRRADAGGRQEKRGEGKKNAKIHPAIILQKYATLGLSWSL
jgi:hypothetical protein